MNAAMDGIRQRVCLMLCIVQLTIFLKENFSKSWQAPRYHPFLLELWTEGPGQQLLCQ